LEVQEINLEIDLHKKSAVQSGFFYALLERIVWAFSAIHIPAIRYYSLPQKVGNTPTIRARGVSFGILVIAFEKLNRQPIRIISQIRHFFLVKNNSKRFQFFQNRQIHFFPNRQLNPGRFNVAIQNL
jgi:hypothetical protein